MLAQLPDIPREWGWEPYCLILVLLGAWAALWRISAKLLEIYDKNEGRRSDAMDKTASACESIDRHCQASSAVQERVAEDLKRQTEAIDGLVAADAKKDRVIAAAIDVAVDGCRATHPTISERLVQIKRELLGLL